MFYLGRYSSEESKAEYKRLIKEWTETSPSVQPVSAPERSDLRINELADAYMAHVEGYYCKGGEQTSEVGVIRQAVKLVRIEAGYGHTLAREFGPLALMTCQTAMIAKGWSRKSINRQIGRVRKMFVWAVSRQLIPASVLTALATVEPLRANRTAATERSPIGPVPRGVVEQTIAHVPPTVGAMIRFQLETGARPDEACMVRAADIDMSDSTCWVYTPGRHKNEHRERSRIVMIGPRGIEILKPFLTLAVSDYLFSPVRSEVNRNKTRSENRKTPRYKSHIVHQQQKKTRRRRRVLRDRYSVNTYRQAIHRGCARAGVEQWNPHQLRHLRADEIERQYGEDGSKAVLGHDSVNTTKKYLSRDLEKARSIMREVG
jgi:integrase